MKPRQNSHSSLRSLFTSLLPGWFALLHRGARRSDRNDRDDRGSHASIPHVATARTREWPPRIKRPRLPRTTPPRFRIHPPPRLPRRIQRSRLCNRAYLAAVRTKLSQSPILPRHDATDLHFGPAESHASGDRRRQRSVDRPREAAPPNLTEPFRRRWTAPSLSRTSGPEWPPSTRSR